MWDFFKKRFQRRSRRTSERNHSRGDDQPEFVESFQNLIRFYGSSGLIHTSPMDYRYGQRGSQRTSQRNNSRVDDQHNFVPSFQNRCRFYGSSGLYLPLSINSRYRFSEIISMFHPHIPKCLERISCSDLLMGNRVEDYFADVSSTSQNEDSAYSPLIEEQNDYDTTGSDVDALSGASINSLIHFEEEDLSITNGYMPVIEAPPYGFPGESPPSYEEAMGLAERWSNRSLRSSSNSDIGFLW